MAAGIMFPLLSSDVALSGVQTFILDLSVCTVALPALGAQYPVFSAAPATKLMEEGKVHAVEHLINPLAMQHPEHSTAAAASVLPAVSTPPPFQVCLSAQISVELYNEYISFCYRT